MSSTIKQLKTGKPLRGRGIKTAQTDIFTLDNGLKLVFYQVPTIDMVSVFVRVHTGSNFEGQYIGSGISHFLEHAMFLGSKNHPGKDSFSNYIGQLGGNDLNAFTSENYTCFQFSVFTRHLENALGGLFDFIYRPLFPKQAVKEEQGTILSEMDLYEDKASDWFYRVIFSRIFIGNPNELPIIGLRKKFNTLSHIELRDYHRTHYRPDNMHLVLVGKFDPIGVEAYLAKKHGLNVISRKETSYIPGGNPIHWTNSTWANNNERKSVPKLTNFKTKATAKTSSLANFKNYPFQITETSHPRVRFTKVSMCYEGFDFHNPKNVTLDVLSHILASGRGSILHQILKEKLGWVERISCNLLQLHPLERSKFFIEFTLPEKVNSLSLAELRIQILKVYNRIINILDNLKHHLTPTLLTGSKNTFLKSFVDEKDDFIDIANSLSYSLANYGHLHYEEEYFNLVKELSLEAILNTNNAIVAKYSPHLFILLPPKSIKRLPLFNNTSLPSVLNIISEQLRFEDLEAFEDALKKNISDYKSEVIPPTSPIVPAKPKLMSTQGILKTNTNILKNGTRLLTKKITGLPKACLQLVFKGGSTLELANQDINSNQLGKTSRSIKGKYIPGSFYLLSKMLFSGNSKYSKATIAEGLRKHGISFSSFSGENSFGLGFSMLSSEIPSLYPFLSSILEPPEYNSKDFKKELKEISYTIKKSEEDSFYLTLKNFKQHFFNHTVFGNDSRGQLSTIQLLKPSHIKFINNNYLVGSNMVAHLTGEYSAEHLEEIKTILNSIPTGLPKSDYFKKIINIGNELPPLHYNRNIVYEYDQGGQSHLVMGYRVPRIGEKDFGIFKLINHYLEGIGGPLFKLRSEDFVKNGKSLGGRCYRLGCFLRNSMGYGMLVFYASFRNEAANEHEWAVAAFQKELHKLRTKLIAPKELERSKNTLLSDMLQESLKHVEISFNEALLELYGLGHNFGEKEITELQKVSAEKIREVAKRYLGADNFFAYGMIGMRENKINKR